MDADNALYTCTNPIDAATYIGVTYDFTEVFKYVEILEYKHRLT